MMQQSNLKLITIVAMYLISDLHTHNTFHIKIEEAMVP
jgi:hypothetical protein